MTIALRRAMPPIVPPIIGPRLLWPPDDLDPGVDS
jgi:hypothetical protein